MRKIQFIYSSHKSYKILKIFEGYKYLMNYRYETIIMNWRVTRNGKEET